MKSKLLIFTLLLVAMLALTMAAQMTSGGNVAQVFINIPKSGNVQQYEAARKRHMGWHRSQGDKWSWQTWQYMTGPLTGNYLVITSGHNWTDFDGREKFEAADNADSMSSMGPYEASVTSAFYILRPDLSLNPNEATSPYVQVTVFRVRPESINNFTESVKKIGDGIRKINYGNNKSRWYQLINGGEGPEYVLVAPRNSISEMKPLDKTLDQAMAEAYGADEGAALLNTIRKSYHSTMTELLQYRSDLSYVPGGAASPTQ